LLRAERGKIGAAAKDDPTNPRGAPDMQALKYLARKFGRVSASMVEYSILIGIITAAAIATIVTVGGKVSTAWKTLNSGWQ
jgi:pilus assembly protein Flp/PilA